MKTNPELIGCSGIFWLSIAVIICAFFSPLAQAALRCGTQLASQGDSTVYVSKICGEPEFKQQRSVYRTLGGKVVNGQRAAFGQETIEIIIDEWLYNFGPNRLQKKIIFENGRLESTESEGYGY